MYVVGDRTAREGDCLMCTIPGAFWVCRGKFGRLTACLVDSSCARQGVWYMGYWWLVPGACQTCATEQKSHKLLGLGWC
jgi:hypothetical protein